MGYAVGYAGYAETSPNVTPSGTEWNRMEPNGTKRWRAPSNRYPPPLVVRRLYASSPAYSGSVSHVPVSPSGGVHAMNTPAAMASSLHSARL